jgi:hypothetical protein
VCPGHQDAMTSATCLAFAAERQRITLGFPAA